MAVATKLDREALKKFNQYWEALYAVVPEARAEAAAEMGRAVKQELDAQIQSADLQSDAKANVASWQEIRLGSKGGYAALSPTSATHLYRQDSGALQPRAWKQRERPGKKPVKKFADKVNVSVRQITKWLDRGHGVRKPAAGSTSMWSRVGKSGLNLQTGMRFVPARQFYAATKVKAVAVARRAADKVLSRIADEVDY